MVCNAPFSSPYTSMVVSLISRHLSLMMKTTIELELVLIATNQMPQEEPSRTEARLFAKNSEAGSALACVPAAVEM